MGWLMMSKPGSKYGPCKKACAHPDCARARLDAARLCALCQKPIGYETKYFGQGADMEHAVCVWERVEKQDAARVDCAVAGHVYHGSIGHCIRCGIAPPGVY